jgi:hypothetical protein
MNLPGLPNKNDPRYIIHIAFKFEKDNNNDCRLETLLHRLQEVEYNSIN